MAVALRISSFVMRKSDIYSVILGGIVFVVVSLVSATRAADEAATSEGQSAHTWPKIPILTVDPSKPPAFKEAEEAAKGFKVPKGLKVSLFAAEPQVVSPVAFSIDEKGRVYVIETFRAWGNGGIDMRQFMHWLDYDMAARTVEDRIAWSKKIGGESANNLTLDSDRVRLLEDRDGDGRADSATIFTDGYNTIESGLAAGILARKGQVYFANIPNLYLLKDTKGDGKADSSTVLASGFGVHYQFLGHDLHGLTMGPDGRLYYSIGDRGVHLTTKEGKVIDNPDSGVVFRSDPDGSNLEVVATGLRNPQELAFDDYGDLFTGDNNCDMGDSARWVYIVDGLDAGWRCGYQFITQPNNGGVWMSENLWHLEGDHPAAWCLPPVGYAPPGPSGLAHYPGTGLGEKYKNRFFLCDFRGGTNSGVWQVAFKSRGATFELAERKQFLWNLLPTDVEFGPDGSLYVSDWVNGWFRPMKGRIWKVSDPKESDSALVVETKKLIGEGMSARPIDELIKLLAHPNQKVRLEAQYELAARGERAIAPLQKLMSEEGDQLARIHAIWGLGQIARKSPRAIKPVTKLLDDGDSELRAQAAKALGEARFTAAQPALIKRLKDETQRVRFFAALAVGKIVAQTGTERRDSGQAGTERRERSDPSAVPDGAERSKPNPAEKPDKSATPEKPDKESKPKTPPAQAIIEMVRENADRDPYVRHAGVMALLWINDQKAIAAAANDSSDAVRLAALLVMRRQSNASVAKLLNDPIKSRPGALPVLADEAARAIYDSPIESAMPALAAQLKEKITSRPVWLRAIAANLRLGGAENAALLAKVAGDATEPEDARVEALWALANWADAPGRDRVIGLWRPIAPRDKSLAVEAAKGVLAEIVKTAPDKVKIAAISAIEKLGAGAEGLPAMVRSKDLKPDVRAAALHAVAILKLDGLDELAKLAFHEGAGTSLRREAIQIQMNQPDAAARLEAIYKDGTVPDQKAVLEALVSPLVTGTSGKSAIAEAVLAGWMDKLLAGNVPAELHLDLLEAAGRSSSKLVAAKVKEYEGRRDPKDPLSGFTESLVGGDAKKGEKIYLEKGSVACVRCHKIGGDQVTVGPDLAGLASRKDRRYMLESILKPNAQIAPGFESVLLKLKGNETHAGVLRKEDAKTITLAEPDEGITVYDKSEVISRSTGLSPMPEGLEKMLTKRELRDLVEFLASQK